MSVWPDDSELLVTYRTFAEYRENGGWRTTSNAWQSARGRRLRDGIVPSDAEPLFDGDLDAWYDAIKERTRTVIAKKAQVREVQFDTGSDNWVGIVFLGDIHIGGLIDYDLLEQDLDLIEQTDGLFVVGMGDYCDNFQATPKLQKAMADNTVPASDEQLELASMILGRTSKWVALLLGNHDGWSGPSGVERLADRLDCAYVSEAGGSLKVGVGNERYVGYVKHQWKGHSNINTSNESRRMWSEFPEWENADFTVLAHYHQPDTHTKEIKTQTVSHLRSGTYKLHDDYAAKGGYVPAYGPSLILLNPNDHICLPWHGPHWKWGVEFLNYLQNRGRQT